MPNQSDGHKAEQMASDDDTPKKKVGHEIGQDLALLSVEELAARITLLNAEIERLRSSMTLKRATRDAADRFFKS